MNKINLNGVTQGCTAEQLNAIAQNILNRKGDVDMSSCNVTITPPSGMNAGMAGIIVKCAEESGGTVVINGHTEIDDELWSEIQANGCPQFIIDNCPSKGLLSALSMYIAYPIFKDIVEACSLKAPIIASDAETGEDMWMMRSPASYTGWEELDTIMAQTDWQYLEGGFSNNGGYCTKVGTITSSNQSFAKFFVPTKMPTGFSEEYADHMYVTINGTRIFTGDSYHGSVVNHSFDFSSIIKLNEVNVIAMSWPAGNGGNGIDFGFTYD